MQFVFAGCVLDGDKREFTLRWDTRETRFRGAATTIGPPSTRSRRTRVSRVAGGDRGCP